jgi:DNA-binding PadR family transcriptional regulator
MLRYILLGFLTYQPMTGYDLKSLMEQSTSHFWHAYHSQIYTTLRKLEEEGMVTSEEIQEDDQRLNRRFYELTEAGRDDFLNWLYHSLAELPQVKEDLLVRLFFSGKRDRTAVLDELRLQRYLHQQKLDLYLQLQETRILPDTVPQVQAEVPFWRMTLDFGQRFERMYLQWLDDTIQQLNTDS